MPFALWVAGQSIASWASGIRIMAGLHDLMIIVVPAFHVVSSASVTVFDPSPSIGVQECAGHSILEARPHIMYNTVKISFDKVNSLLPPHILFMELSCQICYVMCDS